MSRGDRMQDYKDDGDQPGQALYRNKHLPCNRQSKSNAEKPFLGRKNMPTVVERNKDKNIKFK